MSAQCPTTSPTRRADYRRRDSDWTNAKDEEECCAKNDVQLAATKRNYVPRSSSHGATRKAGEPMAHSDSHL